jgi:hypothetical protein
MLSSSLFFLKGSSYKVANFQLVAMLLPCLLAATVMVSGPAQQTAATMTNSQGGYVILALFANGVPYTVTAIHQGQSLSTGSMAPSSASIQVINFGLLVPLI